MKLIIINGPCGAGKSTLSAKLHADMPLSFLLDIDAQRRFISHYRKHKEESSKISLAISNAIIKCCLEVKCNVIIDKMIFDQNILNFYYEMAKIYNADIYEIILWAPKEIIMKRATERGYNKNSLLTPKKCELFWCKINELKKIRSQAHVINIKNLKDNELYEKVIKIVN